MDGVTILNQFESTTRTPGDFNNTAAIIALVSTIILCAVAGFFLAEKDGENEKGAGIIIGIMCGVVIGFFISGLAGNIFGSPPIEHTTTRYEVIIDDTVSMKDFTKHYNIVEQRGDIFVVEKNDS